MMIKVLDEKNWYIHEFGRENRKAWQYRKRYMSIGEEDMGLENEKKIKLIKNLNL